MRLRTILIALTLLLALGGAGIALALSSISSDKSDSELNLGQMRQQLAELPRGSLTQDEKQAISTLREGTKLNHDLYTAFASQFDLPVFANNAFNSQTQSDATVLLIERYGLSDPAAGRAEGQFKTQRFRDLYVNLLDEGKKSREAALRKSLELEELDIIYLKNLLAHTDQDDLSLVYNTMLRGAALDMRDFALANRSIGAPRYVPQHLSQAEYNEAIRGRLDQASDAPLLLRASDFGRCGIDDLQVPRRRRQANAEQVGPDTAVQRELCSTEMSVAGSATKTIKLGARTITARLLSTSAAAMPAPVDSNSPAFWQNGSLSLFNSWDSETYRSSGNEVDTLADPVLIQLPRPARPGSVWLEATWLDTQTNILYGWYHLEPSDLPCAPLTAPIIGAAVSRDGGLTWEDRGPVLTAAYAFDCSYDNGYFVGGVGDLSVILGPRGQNFYFLYSNYAGPANQQGIGIARSPVADKGQPGTLTKYYEGGWKEPGIGGKTTPLFPTPTGWAGPYVDAFWGASVSWNPSIQAYVALLNHTQDDSATWAQEGVYLSLSTDLMTWTPPEKILDTNNWYPQVLGLSRNGSDSLAERYMRIYVGGVSRYILDLTAQNGG